MLRNVDEMKIIQAIPGMPSNVTEPEVISLLGQKLNMQLATLDAHGDPVIQPVWFYFDAASANLFTGTNRMSRKVDNIRRNPDRIYFSIDDENFPYKGVKGKGTGRILEDIKKNTEIMEKINMKYLGTLEHPLAKTLMENTRNGTEVVIQVLPKFFSAWDFSKVS